MLITQQTQNNRNRTKYAQPNQYIAPGFYTELYECLHWCQMEDAVEIMTSLGLNHYKVCTNLGLQRNISELCDQFGPKAYCYSIGPVWFHAGPEKNIDSVDSRDRYEFISASVLSLVMDCILYRVSSDGFSVLKTLEIPL